MKRGIRKHANDGASIHSTLHSHVTLENHNTIVIFTDHARKRMKERKILRVHAILAVAHYDFTKREEGDAQLYRKKIHDKTLEVVAEIKKNKIIIITLYWI